MLNGPEKAASLIEADVIRPAVERGEALLAFAFVAAAVIDSVGARTVLGYADKEAAVVAKVGGLPVLRVGY